MLGQAVGCLLGIAEVGTVVGDTDAEGGLRVNVAAVLETVPYPVAQAPIIETVPVEGITRLALPLEPGERAILVPEQPPPEKLPAEV